MKLFCTPNSPFARTVRIFRLELGLEDQIEMIIVTVRDENSELLKFSPSGKVPALLIVSSDGVGQQVLTDTQTIVRYMSRRAEQKEIVASLDDVSSLSFEGLCMGMLESISVWAREARKTAELVSSSVCELERTRANRCLTYLNNNLGKLNSDVSLSAVSLACALDIAERRLDADILKDFVPLARWFSSMKGRPSFISTEPIPV